MTPPARKRTGSATHGQHATSSATLLILGAGGDLTHRLLLPGLASLLMVEQDREVRVIGCDRTPKTAPEWRALMKDSFDSVQAPAKVLRRAQKNTKYLDADLLDPDALQQVIDECATGRPLVIFFALPPAVTAKICDLLQNIELPHPTRLALEKPFGTDARSAHNLNQTLQRVVPENQIFRVDHFLGVSTVLNLIGLRFSNRLLQPVWNSESIEKVEIVYDEALALEGRAGYYDTAGALKDMLQSHLLQVMGLFAMESIASLEPIEVHDQIAQVLRATRLWGNSPKRAAKRARYTAGKIGDRKIPSYVDEKGVDPARNTETLAQLTLEVDNNRWKGVPITLRSGKALGEPNKRIIATFREVPHVPTGFTGTGGCDKLIIDLKPGAVTMVLSMNAEGGPYDMEQKELRAELAPGRMQPYGEILADILDGQTLLSVRGDAAEECWRIVEPVLKAFKDNKIPLEEYPAGSAGPDGWAIA